MAVHLLIRSLFSLGKTWTPTVISAVSLIVQVAIALSLLHTDGTFGSVGGISLATSVANIVGVVLLYLSLKKHAPSMQTNRIIGDCSSCFSWSRRGSICPYPECCRS